MIEVSGDAILYRLWLTFGTMDLCNRARENIETMEGQLEVVFDVHNLKMSREMSLKDMRCALANKFACVTICDDEVTVLADKREVLDKFEWIADKFTKIIVNQEEIQLMY